MTRPGIAARFDQPTVVVVWSPHCASCRAMEADIELVRGEFAGTVEVVKVNAAVEPDVVHELGVRGTPTLLGVRGRRVRYRHTGRLDARELRAFAAGLVEGVAPEGLGHRDKVLRVATGGALVVLGAVTGPAWPLLIAGLAIVGYGMAPVWWTGRR